MSIHSRVSVLLAIGAVTLAAAIPRVGATAQPEILHDFSFAEGGAGPRAALTLDGSTLFGMGGGGEGNFGTIFAIDTDGSNFHVVHEFDGGALGSVPIGEVEVVGSRLFGTTRFGGTANLGTVFSVNNDGTNFQVLHSFTGGPGDGADPMAGLTAVGSALYGTTFGGGDTQSGTIFSLDTNGSDYQLLHSFGTTVTDGRNPAARMTLNGSTLYGTTELGGSTQGFVGYGSVFAIDVDGSNYHVVYGLGTGGSNENDPRAPVIVEGSTIYGTAWSGGLGSGGDGAVFSVETDGSNFQLLHGFSVLDPANGYLLPGPVTRVGSRLYSTAFFGGDAGQGTIFSLETDGSDFRVEHAFGGATSDGAWPLAGLTAVGSQLLGTTQIGGEFNDGAIFSLVVPEPNTLLIMATAVGLAGALPKRRNRGPMLCDTEDVWRDRSIDYGQSGLLDSGEADPACPCRQL